MTAHVYAPDQQPCGNGCHTGHGDTRAPVLCDGRAHICPRCIDRLDTWLRQIPDTHALLPYVVEHGTVGVNPETATTKRPDAPAPLRLEVLDLLDARRGYSRYTDAAGRPLVTDNRRGAAGVILDITGRIRTERRLERACDCGHARMLHRWRVPWAARYADGQAVGPVEPYCHAHGCQCARWRVTATLTRECGFVIQHLAWLVEQDWVTDVYADVKLLNRELSDRVGEYRPHPVGMCVATITRDVPGGQIRVVCGGALYRDETGHGVHCASCRARTNPQRLFDIGRSVGLFSHDDGTEPTREAS